MQKPTTPTTRDEVLAAAERLRRAARLLEAHAQRCTEETAAAHAEALRQARCMVRSVLELPSIGNADR